MLCGHQPLSVPASGKVEAGVVNDLVQSLNVIPGLPPAMTRLERHTGLIGVTILMWLQTSITWGSAQSPFYRQSRCLIVERATETARRACSSRAMRCLHSQARTDIELCIKCTNSFQVCGTERCLPRSLTQETCSVSSRIALPRLPRVEEGPHHRVSQIWG